MKLHQILLLFFYLIILSGCTILFSPQSSLFTERPQVCQEFLDALDKRVEDAGVRDASSSLIVDFPYLRTNRFLAVLKKNLTDENAREQWGRLLQQLDLRARGKEIQNLPEQTVISLMSEEEANREWLYNRVESCSNELFSHDTTYPEFYENLLPLVGVPDEYSFLRRAFGLYPVFSLPVAFLTVKSRKASKARFASDLNDIPPKGVLRHVVPEEEVVLSEEEVREIIEGAKRNPLHIPLLDDVQREKLISAFAPIIIQDVAAPYDRLGKVVWEKGRLAIDSTHPTVYYYTSHAFFKGEPILQINYGIWYSKTAGKETPWIERGYLDGLTTRISLDAQGRPFMIDVMKNCGCYQLFAPEKERFQGTVSRRLKPDLLIAQWMPTVPPGKRLGVRVSSGWHQVERLLATESPPHPTRYQLLPYDVLEILPYDNGETKSMFNQKGVVEDSKRGKEEILLFSMGVPSVGSMRQRGRHPSELIGRVHCDEPELFDRYFILK
ncbi:MAG: hypothetical protein JRF49_07185 [Deltaproteobacteria bacterium]|jgi:hypothetical protein|nr:hypothetical protein [Deltaproteobacteria bacterium]